MKKLFINLCWWIIIPLLWLTNQIVKLLNKLGAKKIKLKEKKKKKKKLIKVKKLSKKVVRKKKKK